MRRAVLFLVVSSSHTTLSVPAPVWQSEQSKASEEVITPMLPIKSATVSPFNGVVVTFLKTSPADWPLGGTADACCCAVARLPSSTPIIPTSATPASAGTSRLERSFIDDNLHKTCERVSY